MSKARLAGASWRRESVAHARRDPLCIGHNTGSEKLVRAAARLGHGWVASGTRCMLKPLPCTATGKKTSGNSQRLTSGAGTGRETATLSDPAEEKAVVRYARDIISARLFSVARPRAAGGVGNVC